MWSWLVVLLVPTFAQEKLPEQASLVRRTDSATTQDESAAGKGDAEVGRRPEAGIIYGGDGSDTLLGVDGGEDYTRGGDGTDILLGADGGEDYILRSDGTKIPVDSTTVDPATTTVPDELATTSARDTADIVPLFEESSTFGGEGTIFRGSRGDGIFEGDRAESVDIRDSIGFETVPIEKLFPGDFKGFTPLNTPFVLEFDIFEKFIEGGWVVMDISVNADPEHGVAAFEIIKSDFGYPIWRCTYKPNPGFTGYDIVLYEIYVQSTFPMIPQELLPTTTTTTTTIQRPGARRLQDSALIGQVDITVGDVITAAGDPHVSTPFGTVDMWLPMDTWTPLLADSKHELFAKGFGRPSKRATHWFNGFALKQQEAVVFEAKLPCKKTADQTNGYLDVVVGGKPFVEANYTTPDLNITKKKIGVFKSIPLVAFELATREFECMITTATHKKPRKQDNSLINFDETPRVHLDIKFSKFGEGLSGFFQEVYALNETARSSETNKLLRDPTNMELDAILQVAGGACSDIALADIY